MIKKMCPVCDLPVSGINYCPRCKRVIKHPVIQNVDYYLNERHPENEAGCEFHNPYLEADHHGESRTAGQKGGGARPGSRTQPGAFTHSGSGSQGGSAARSGSGAGGGSAARSGSGAQSAFGTKPVPRPAHTEGSGRLPGGYRMAQANGADGTYQRKPSAGAGAAGMGRSSGTQNRSRKNSILITGIMIGLTLLLAAGKYCYNYLLEKANYAVSDDYGYDYDYTEFSDEEVAAAGKACDGYYHFPADGESVGSVMLAAVENSGYGYTVDSDSYYVDNYAYDGITYFECYRSIYLTDAANAGYEETDENYFYQYIDLNYDTATGEFHEYSTSLNNEEASLAFLEQFLSEVEEESGIAQEERRTAAIMEEAREMVAQGQNNYIYEGMFAVEMYRGEHTLYIDVTYNDPEAAAGAEL